ncbi:uncharacterized protein MONBRDRAFT_32615 [Monosiga brevicollis MX1]|uniref:Protein ENHANCED DISEASE RESISTANCE 2 C-terminal domain-containing protein n=1 Tax=Monosiga brevicollis TaxID=81824 RepID=A9V0Q8_MONBE|nr:uncharacterized protein MONBRDRAFT_32615 [Monosiga brevicollis MX1]EDQ88795.1 predicted protein [Monosiga brevicollis MX1]|eukprot:XP_001746408.1 hypothetical protein [Monosiga brevicollis MX1]
MAGSATSPSSTSGGLKLIGDAVAAAVEATESGSLPEAAEFIAGGHSGFRVHDLESSGWDVGDGSTFRVRRGPDYKKNGKKELSLPQMYDAVAVDCFRVERRCYPIAPIINLPALPDHLADWKHEDVPATFILNIQLPGAAAKMFSSDIDGPTVHLIIYYHLRPDAARAIGEGVERQPAHDLWARWCREAFDDEKMRGRFKMIGVVDNFKDIGLPSILETYNGKPCIIYKTGSIAKGADCTYIEAGINVHLFPYLTRNMIWSYRAKSLDMQLHIAGTIEARSDEEMPERVVFTNRITNMHVFDSPLLSAAAIDLLMSKAQATGHNAVIAQAGSEVSK